MASVSLNKVAKRYGSVEVIHGVDAEIADGEFVVLVGPSGCGKSTLLRMIAGLEDITGGEIAIGGKVVNALPPKARDISMVFQNYALYPHMTVEENMAFSMTLAGAPKEEKKRKVREAAEILGLTPLLERKPRALSGGQRQRVAMGRAIVRKPAAFLFDEPLSNLDAKLRVSMRGEIKHLQKRLGTTSIYVTHDQLEAMTLADRLVVLNGGRIEQIGTPLDVYHKPASTFVANFIGSPAMNLVQGKLTQGQLTIGDNSMQFSSAPPADGPVTVGIRPEDLQPTAGAGLKARLDYVEELGATRLAHCLTGGERLTAALSPEIPLADELTFAVLPEKVHFYDHATGKRLSTA